MKSLTLKEIAIVNGGLANGDMLYCSIIGGWLLGGIGGALVGRTAFTFGGGPGGVIGGFAGGLSGMVIGCVAMGMGLDYGFTTPVVVSSMAGFVGYGAAGTFMLGW